MNDLKYENANGFYPTLQYFASHKVEMMKRNWVITTIVSSIVSGALILLGMHIAWFIDAKNHGQLWKDAKDFLDNNAKFHDALIGAAAFTAIWLLHGSTKNLLGKPAPGVELFVRPHFGFQQNNVKVKNTLEKLSQFSTDCKDQYELAKGRHADAVYSNSLSAQFGYFVGHPKDTMKKNIVITALATLVIGGVIGLFFTYLEKVADGDQNKIWAWDGVKEFFQENASFHASLYGVGSVLGLWMLHGVCKDSRTTGSYNQKIEDNPNLKPELDDGM